jgi:hypothetical protein
MVLKEPIGDFSNWATFVCIMFFSLDLIAVPSELILRVDEKVSCKNDDRIIDTFFIIRCKRGRVKFHEEKPPLSF